MITKWIESIFIKRAVLAAVSAFAAYVALHQVQVIPHLAALGITITINIDKQKLTDVLVIGVFGILQGLHEWLAVKYPELGKYL